MIYYIFMTKNEAYKNLENLRTWRLWKMIYILTTALIAAFMLSIARDVATVTRYNEEFDILYPLVDTKIFMIASAIYITLVLVASFLTFRLMKRIFIYILYGSLEKKPSPTSS